MRKFMFAIAALATLGGSMVTPADAEIMRHPVRGVAIHHPGCLGPHCIHGIIRHRICTKWVFFRHERRCIHWRWVL